MRKPEVTLKEIPEVREEIRRIQELPAMYHGTEYEYRYVISPEESGGLIILRWYNVKMARNEGDHTEECITYIDAAKGEWITYVTAERKWSRATIANTGSVYFDWRDVLVIHPERLKTRQAFTGAGDHPLKPVLNWQKAVNGKKLEKRQQKKDNETNSLMEQAKPLTEAFLRWHEETAMKDSRYLIYQRSEGKTFRAYCTHCRGYMDIPAPECRHDKKRKCPRCGSRVTMKAAGRAKKIVDTAWTEYVQAVRGGLMIRFVKMIKIYEGQTEPERIVTEPSRVVIEKGKKPVWYEKRESNTKYKSHAEYQKNKGELCVHGYNFPRKGLFRGVYRRGLEAELKKAFPYNTFMKWMERNGGKPEQYSVYDYFAAYSILPLIESLEKTGKAILVDEIVKDTGSEEIRRLRWIDRTAATVSGMLGITRKQYRLLNNPTVEEIRACRVLNQHGIEADGISIYRIVNYTRDYSTEGDLQKILGYMPLRKFLKYTEGKEKYDFRNYYFDYLRMGEILGYDFGNDFVLFPRDIKKAHDEAVNIINGRNRKKQLAIAAEKDEGIRKMEKKIRRKFTYQDERYLIRPAKTNCEIVKEGQDQHICVGNGTYRERMEKGESYILFLRRRNEPDKPFYTVEITPDYKILQRRGKYNKAKEEKESVDQFLKKFLEVKGNGREYHAE